MPRRLAKLERICRYAMTRWHASEQCWLWFNGWHDAWWILEKARHDPRYVIQE